MRSAAPNVPATWPTPGSHGRAVELSIQSLTPIYKGGATTEKIDVGRPFRVPSIRGMLRYWWRATSSLPTTADLRNAERAIFGGVFPDARSSGVTVSVRTMQSTPGPRPTDKPYAFGVCGNPPPGPQVHRGATGLLRVEWKAGLDRETRRALDAWLLFGGIGGRSRRGCGSVWWDGAPATPDAYLAAARSLIPVRTGPPRWPTLAGGSLLLGPAYSNADQAWAGGLDGMRAVRASKDVSPGLLATIGRASATDWKQRDYIPVAAHQHWSSPRAALGLPIRFQGTQAHFILTGAGINRFPSPIHLKVVRLGTASFRPVFTVLQTTMPTQLTAGTSTGTLDPSGLATFLSHAGRLPGWALHSL